MEDTSRRASFVLVVLLAAAGPRDSIAGSGAPDGREDLEASGYVGVAIDTFAAQELNRYLNQEDSGGLRERSVVGVDFAYRLTGEKGDSHQLWLYAETVHGTRSADIDCSANPDFPTCRPYQGQIDPSGEFLFILRNASSLEGFAGLRWEIAALHPGGSHPARLYLKAQAGFLSVAGVGGDVVEVSHGGAGLYIVDGDYRDSYFEIGFGKTDLFQDRSGHRWKLDGLLSFPWRLGRKRAIHAFLQMTVDTDLGSGADSVQSYVGFDFHFVRK